MLLASAQCLMRALSLPYWLVSVSPAYGWILLLPPGPSHGATARQVFLRERGKTGRIILARGLSAPVRLEGCLCAALSHSCSSLPSAEVCVLGCCRNGPLDPALEVSKKGTLKLDLQALTVGVAVLSMHHWLVQLRPQLASEPAAGPEASRKLAVVNGMGENNRTQVRHPGPLWLHCHWCPCADPGRTGSVL